MFLIKRKYIEDISTFWREYRSSFPTRSFRMWKCLWQMSLEFLSHWIRHGDIGFQCKFSCSVLSHDHSNMCHISIHDTLKFPLDSFTTSGVTWATECECVFYISIIAQYFLLLTPIIWIQFYVLLQGRFNQPMSYPQKKMNVKVWSFFVT